VVVPNFSLTSADAPKLTKNRNTNTQEISFFIFCFPFAIGLHVGRRHTKGMIMHKYFIPVHKKTSTRAN
jgi:hypothetical protein